MCYRCHVAKPFDEFYKDRSRSCGYGNTCRECDNKKNLANKAIRRDEKRRERKAEGRGSRFNDETEKRIRELKSKPCMDCNQCFPPVCMDFDHRDPSKKLFSVSMWRSYSAFEIVEEIAKCDVVCANCHRVRTFPQQVEVTEFDD